MTAQQIPKTIGDLLRGTVTGQVPVWDQTAGVWNAADVPVPNLSGYQPLLPTGTVGQYFRGDKTLGTLNADAIPDFAAKVAAYAPAPDLSPYARLVSATFYDPTPTIGSTLLSVRAGAGQINPVASFVRNSDGSALPANAVLIEATGTQMQLRSPLLYTNDYSVGMISGALQMGMSALKFGPNPIVTDGGEDWRLYRSGTKGATIDDTGGGAANLAVTGIITSPQFDLRSPDSRILQTIRSDVYLNGGLPMTVWQDYHGGMSAQVDGGGNIYGQRFRDRMDAVSLSESAGLQLNNSSYVGWSSSGAFYIGLDTFLNRQSIGVIGAGTSSSNASGKFSAAGYVASGLNGVSGTFASPTSITVTGGIITAIS